jgi:putative cell wall binding repeat protein
MLEGAVTVYAKRRVAVVAGLAIGVAVIGVGAYLLADALSTDEAPSAPAPQIVIQGQEPEAATDLGFPAFATKNTTRVAGADPIADAAGVALAVYPSAGGVEGPAAVTIVDEADWPSGIAAAVLAGPPVGAPILLGTGDTLPELTSDALRALAPQGTAQTGGTQIFVIGDAATPRGPGTRKVTGKSPAAIAAAIDRLRQELTGERPRAIVLANSDDAEYAMPAAGWAARSGDPVLFVQRDTVPGPTLAALERHHGVPVYVLGPESVISGQALKAVREVAPQATRIAGADPVANAIAFARYVNGGFGWDINDPGHGLVIASTDRPQDAAAAAPLSASGTWGPLLLTDDPREVPAELQSYLLDIKPGYQDDPTRAVYNHAWLIGDVDVMSVDFQAQIDDLAEVAPVRSGTGSTPFGPAPGTPESEETGKP